MKRATNETNRLEPSQKFGQFSFWNLRMINQRDERKTSFFNEFLTYFQKKLRIIVVHIKEQSFLPDFHKIS